jgi:uncharacterized paraquat-inducible protein A
MALKRCPDCGASVSTKAPACPRCGRSNEGAFLSPSANARSCLGCLFLLALGWMALVVLQASSGAGW